MMAKFLRLLLPLLVIAIALITAQWLKHHRPQAQQKKQARAQVLNVQVSPLASQEYQAWVASYGSIRPHTESSLITQVAGRVSYLSADFREGAFFEQGDILLKLDPRDYQNAITIADAELILSQQLLAEEQAKVDQALRDWQRLGKGKAATDLVLRKPQLAARNAALASAKAKLAQAKLDLERTRIVAPYSGRVLSKQIELSEFVSAGSNLATIFAVDYLELRLPISLAQQAVLHLPESYRNSPQESQYPQVNITSHFGQQSYQWQGKIVRTEAALDSDSRQLYVVAQIDDPFSPNNQGKSPLKIGQFVSANIAGKQLQSVFVIPHAALYPDGYVMLLKDGLLQRRQVNILWQDKDSYIIDKGLQAGELLVTTPLGQVVSGTPAKRVEN